MVWLASTTVNSPLLSAEHQYLCTPDSKKATVVPVEMNIQSVNWSAEERKHYHFKLIIAVVADTLIKVALCSAPRLVQPRIHLSVVEQD